MADSQKYPVKKGDSLIKIAKHYEVKDWKALWRHPENKDLNKKYKGDETKIQPKDILSIPAELSQMVAGYPVRPSADDKQDFSVFSVSSVVNSIC
jgi:LysM repeat protein